MIKPGDTVTKWIEAEFTFDMRRKFGDTGETGYYVDEENPENNYEYDIWGYIKCLPAGSVSVNGVIVSVRYIPGAYSGWSSGNYGIQLDYRIGTGSWIPLAWWQTQTLGMDMECDCSGTATVTLKVSQDYTVGASDSLMANTGDLCSVSQPPLWCSTPDNNGSFDHGLLTEIGCTPDGDAEWDLTLTITGAEELSAAGATITDSGTVSGLAWDAESVSGGAGLGDSTYSEWALEQFGSDVQFCSGTITSSPADVASFASGDVTYQQLDGNDEPIMRIANSGSDFTAYLAADAVQDSSGTTPGIGVELEVGNLPVTYTYAFDFPDDTDATYHCDIDERINTYDSDDYEWDATDHPGVDVTGGSASETVTYLGYAALEAGGVWAVDGTTYPDYWVADDSDVPEAGHIEINDLPDNATAMVKYAIVDPGSLTTNGQPVYDAVRDIDDEIIIPGRGDWRLPMRLESWTWDAISLQVHDDVVLHELDTATGWTGTHCTPGTSSGSLTLEVDEGETGEAVKDYSSATPPPNLCHYRFVDLAWSCTDATKGFRLVLMLTSSVGRYWDVAYNQNEIDLCCPTGLYSSGVYSTWTGGDADEQSAIPYLATGTTEEWYWGVKEIHSIRFAELAGGETYTLTSITGKVKSSAVWYDSNQWGWRDDVDSTDPEPPDDIAMVLHSEDVDYKHYREIAGWVIVDGMPAVEISGQAWALSKDEFGMTPHINVLPALDSLEYFPVRDALDTAVSFSLTAAAGGAGYLDNDQTIRHLDTPGDTLTGLTTETAIGATYRPDRVQMVHASGYDSWTMTFRKRWGHRVSVLAVQNGAPLNAGTVNVTSDGGASTATTNALGHVMIALPRQVDTSDVTLAIGAGGGGTSGLPLRACCGGGASVDAPVRQRRITFAGLRGGAGGDTTSPKRCASGAPMRSALVS